ncbi:MAG TPA: thioredoxin family protein [Sulfurovum sp. UBA12169]|nr:MAG TPA: thioredoxin family protein [Sulfurovum sp. UBA12169]
MKKIIILMGIFWSGLFGTELVWQKDIDAAFEIAQKEHKNIMLMVESQNCRWCKKMEDETLADENVQKRLASYSLVKVSRGEERIMDQLPMIHGVPTIFFMTPEKKILQKVVGYFNVEDFLGYIDDAERIQSSSIN